jgi:nucleotide-binding universal stress UspA family protein
MLSIKKILHATDFSDLSQPAFDMACALARDFGAELIVCHIAPPTAITAVEGMIVDVPTEDLAQVKARLEQLKPNNSPVRVTHRLLRGDPAGEIIRLAGEAKADLVVMGTHGRSGLGRLLMGSVAEAVMRKSPCPVVTVKAPLPADQPRPPAKRLTTA